MLTPYSVDENGSRKRSDSSLNRLSSRAISSMNEAIAEGAKFENLSVSVVMVSSVLLATSVSVALPSKGLQMRVCD